MLYVMVFLKINGKKTTNKNTPVAVIPKKIAIQPIIKVLSILPIEKKYKITNIDNKAPLICGYEAIPNDLILNQVLPLYSLTVLLI